MSNMRLVKKYLMPAVPVLGFVGIALYFFLSQDRAAHFAIRSAASIDSQHLLVIERSGFENSTMDRARLTVIDLQGNVLSEVVERGGPVRLHLIQDEVAWLENFDRGLHRRRLPGLEVVGGAQEAVDAHPMLSNGATVAGHTEQGLVLGGKDQKYYVLGPDLSIVDKGRTFEFERTNSSGGQDADLLHLGVKGSVDVGDRTFGPDRDDFLDGETIVQWPSAEPLVLEDPKSVLVAHMDFRGAGSSRQLSRVTLDGQTRWTIAVRDALSDVKMEGKPGWGLQWLDMLDGRLFALMEARLWYKSTAHRDAYGIYEKRLVELDPKTGEVLAAIPLREPEED